MSKKTSKVVMVDGVPIKPISAVEHRRLDKRIKRKHERLRKRYREVHGPEQAARRFPPRSSLDSR